MVKAFLRNTTVKPDQILQLSKSVLGECFQLFLTLWWPLYFAICCIFPVKMRHERANQTFLPKQEIQRTNFCTCPGYFRWKAHLWPRDRHRTQERCCTWLAKGAAPGTALRDSDTSTSTLWLFSIPGLNGMSGCVCSVVSGEMQLYLYVQALNSDLSKVKSRGKWGVFPIEFILSSTAHTLKHKGLFGVATGTVCVCWPKAGFMRMFK